MTHTARNQYFTRFALGFATFLAMESNALSEEAAVTEAVPVVAPAAETVPAVEAKDRVLLDFVIEDALDRVIPQHGSAEFVERSIVDYDNAGAKAKALQVIFKPNTRYPGVNFKPSGDVWNLADFDHILIRVTNTGESNARGSIRLDNPGNWKTNPWMTINTGIPAGTTKTIKVALDGFTTGGKKFEPSQLVSIVLFLNSPKVPATLRIEEIKAVAKQP